MSEEKNQGEPVALPERKPGNSLNFNASLVADGWNACLDEIAKLGPLYTHADPGEVERLHSKIETMRRKNNEYCEEVERLTRKCQNADLALKVQTQNCDSLRKENARLLINISEMNDEAKLREAQLAEREDTRRGRRGGCRGRDVAKGVGEMNRNNWADWQEHLRKVKAREDELLARIKFLEKEVSFLRQKKAPGDGG